MKTKEKERLWRKTRSPGTICYGTDANRNFDIHWMLIGASSWQCSLTFAGRAPFSEPEAETVGKFFLANRGNIKLYLDLHSYGPLILHPWGHTPEPPENVNELQLLGHLVRDAIATKRGTNFTVGSSNEVLYALSGGSRDYAAGPGGVDLAYTIELPPGGSDGFNPEASEIIPVVTEVWEGIKERLWRKTRTPGTICDGADGNRNFDYMWMVTGASHWQCSQTYAGYSAFSELETRAVRDFILANKENIKLFLDIHSYGEWLLYPWGFTPEPPDNVEELHFLADRVKDAIFEVRGTNYTVGSSNVLLYDSSGGSRDYTKGVAGVELAYTVELPRGGSSGFDPDASEIISVVTETWEGIKVYHQHIKEKFAN